MFLIYLHSIDERNTARFFGDNVLTTSTIALIENAIFPNVVLEKCKVNISYKLYYM